MEPIPIYESDVKIRQVYYIDKMTVICHDDITIKIIKEYENIYFHNNENNKRLIKPSLNLFIKNSHIILFNINNNYLTINLDNKIIKIPCTNNHNVDINITEFSDLIEICNISNGERHILNLLTKKVKRNLKLIKGNSNFISATYNNKWCIYDIKKDKIIRYFDNKLSYIDNDLFYDGKQIYHMEIDTKNKCSKCNNERITNKIIIPCGHTKLCEKCFTKVKNKCPICNKDCDNIIKIK